MSIVTIDTEKCNGDALCCLACPAGVLVFDKEKNQPQPIAGAEEFCINCGHCVCVCPTGALAHRAMSVEQCPVVPADWAMDRDKIVALFRSRRSIRNYQKKIVERKVLEELISAASYAPSGHNRQPVHWKVVYGRDQLQDMAALVVDWMRYMVKEQPEFAKGLHMERSIKGFEAGQDVICRGAPHLILNHALDGDPTAPAACTIALTYLELALPAFGLGGCFAGYFHAASLFWPPLQKVLDLPEGHKVFGAMVVGCPRFRYLRQPVRKAPAINWIG